jgi:hypothetical protein
MEVRQMINRGMIEPGRTLQDVLTRSQSGKLPAGSTLDIQDSSGVSAFSIDEATRKVTPRVLGFDQNVGTLTADKTLATTDLVIQKLDPDGATRRITLPPEADSTDLIYWLYNAADGAGENLIVEDDTPTTIITLGPGMSGMFSCDGTSWKCLDDTGVYYDAVSGNRGIGTTSLGAKLEIVESDNDHVSVYLKPGGTAKNANLQVYRTLSSGSLVASGNLSTQTTISGIPGFVLATTDTNTQPIELKTYNGSVGYIAFSPRGTERVRIDISGNVIIGATAAGTSAAKVLAMALGTAPTSTVADVIQVVVQDYAAGDARLYVYGEASLSPVVLGNGTVAPHGGSEIDKAMSGDIVLECDPATAGTSAATLNAAAAGTFTKDIVINLKDAAGNLHKWASLAVNAVTSEAVADVDVAAPTVSDTTPDLVNGTVTVTLTYDTDGGATKTYAAGDTVTLTISQPTDGILGYAIADATFVDTIVA